MISKRDAAIIVRIFGRLEIVAERLYLEGRTDDAHAVWRILGAVQYQLFEVTCCSDMEAA